MSPPALVGSYFISPKRGIPREGGSTVSPITTHSPKGDGWLVYSLLHLSSPPFAEASGGGLALPISRLLLKTNMVFELSSPRRSLRSYGERPSNAPRRPICNGKLYICQ